jgi:SEC-C motif domain protein
MTTMMMMTPVASSVVATATARRCGGVRERHGLGLTTMRARGRCVAGGAGGTTPRTTTVIVRARKGLLAEKFAESEEGDSPGAVTGEADEGEGGEDARARGCPCGRDGKSYGECCARLHDGASTSATPEEVMRARFTAYTQKRCEYIVSSTHDDSKDMARNNLLADAERTVARIRFLKFRVRRSTVPNDGEDGDAYVTYEADFDKGAKKAKSSRTKAKTLAERARLRKDATTGAWKFVDAVALNANTIDDDGSEDIGDQGFGSAAGRKNGNLHKIF